MADKQETPYQKYKKSRLETGDFNSTKKAEINKEISQAWKDMSTEEKAVYGVVSAKKQSRRKRTGFDVFLEEAVEDLSLTSTVDVNADAVRDKTEALWKRMSPEAKQKYEDIAAKKSRKRKATDDQECTPSVKKPKKKVAFDFYLDEKRDEMHQKATEFGFSADQVLFMAMMTFENLPPSERQKYTDRATKADAPQPTTNEVFMIIDDEEPVIKKEKSTSPPPPEQQSDAEVDPEPQQQSDAEVEPEPEQKSDEEVEPEPEQQSDEEVDPEETMRDKFEKCKSDAKRVFELFRSDIDPMISDYNKNYPHRKDASFLLRPMCDQIEKKHNLAPKSLVSIQNKLKIHITPFLLCKEPVFRYRALPLW